MADLVGLGAALLVIYASHVLRHRSAALHLLRASRARNPSITARIGSYLRQALARGGISVPSRHDHVFGLVAMTALITTTVSPFVACVVVASGVAAAIGLDVYERGRQEREIERTSFLVIRLFVLAFGNGCNVRGAIDVVGQHCSGQWAEQLRAISRRIDNGESVADALSGLRARVPGSVRPLVSTLLAGERYGAPLSEVLDRLAEQCRAEQRRHAERSAKRLSVHVLFPLAACTLPAFALLALVPILASALAALA